MPFDPTYCPRCATALEPRPEHQTMRPTCPSCGFIWYRNPVPAAGVLIVSDGRVLLVRRKFEPRAGDWCIPAGFMEAGETPEEGIAREVGEETSLTVESLSLIGVYEFLRMNQVIIAYHAKARGEVVLSPELVDYRTVAPERVKCWPAGTGRALADWLVSRGIEPQWLELPPGKRATEIDVD